MDQATINACLEDFNDESDNLIQLIHELKEHNDALSQHVQDLTKQLMSLKTKESVARVALQNANIRLKDKTSLKFIVETMGSIADTGSISKAANMLYDLGVFDNPFAAGVALQTMVDNGEEVRGFGTARVRIENPVNEVVIKHPHGSSAAAQYNSGRRTDVLYQGIRHQFPSMRGACRWILENSDYWDNMDMLYELVQESGQTYSTIAVSGGFIIEFP